MSVCQCECARGPVGCWKAVERSSVHGGNQRAHHSAGPGGTCHWDSPSEAAAVKHADRAGHRGASKAPQAEGCWLLVATDLDGGERAVAALSLPHMARVCAVTPLFIRVRGCCVILTSAALSGMCTHLGVCVCVHAVGTQGRGCPLCWVLGTFWGLWLCSCDGHNGPAGRWRARAL